MAAFGNSTSDWSESRLRNSKWEKDNSMKGTKRRARVNPLANGQTIKYNPDFEEVEMKKYSDPSKFRPWLELIAHEEYHIMQQDWGIFSLLYMGVDQLLEENPRERINEKTAYSYGSPMKTTSKISKLLSMENGHELYSILSSDKYTEKQKISRASLIGYKFQEQDLLETQSRLIEAFKKNGSKWEGSLHKRMIDEQLVVVRTKIGELEKEIASEKTNN